MGKLVARPIPSIPGNQHHEDGVDQATYCTPNSALVGASNWLEHCLRENVTLKPCSGEILPNINGTVQVTYYTPTYCPTKLESVIGLLFGFVHRRFKAHIYEGNERTNNWPTTYILL